jgi:hypothetical protein
MTVFVLIGDMGYDGQQLMGVYSSREWAEQAFAEYSDTTFLEIMIVEKEIDAKAEISW